MSTRAHTFIVDVAERHGRPLGDGRFEIPLTQAELGRLHDRSPGTVSYYLRCAGSVVVARRHPSLVVDLSTLVGNHHEANESTAPTPRRRLQVAPDAAPVPPSSASPTGSVPSTVSSEQLLDVVSNLLSCLSQISTTLADIAQQLLSASHTGEPANESAKSAKESAKSARSANESAKSAMDISFPSRKEESLPSSSHREVREPTREVRETGTDPSRFGSSFVSSGETPLPYALVDELVAPLRACARQSTRPDTLDDNGREALARLSEAQLRQGVRHAVADASADLGIRKPVGLLVHKALSGQGEYFAPPPLPPRPRVALDDRSPPLEEVDREAIEAVAALEVDESRAEELANVDREVRSWLDEHVKCESKQRVLLRVEANRRGMRQAAWRRLHPVAEKQAVTG